MQIKTLQEQARLKGLTFVEYCYLYLLFNKEPIENFGNIDLNNLLDNGYIKKMEGEMIIRDKGIKIFSREVEIITEEDFKQLFNLYPQSTPKGRKLRPATADSLGYKTLFKSYKEKTKLEKYIYEKAVLGLKREIASRKITGNMEYMQMMSTWINQFSWEYYADTDTPKEYNFEEML